MSEHLKKNPQLFLLCFLIVTSISSILFARSDFDVHPRDIERRLNANWAFRDTMRIDNSRGHGADERLTWSLTLAPDDQNWLRVYFFGQEETISLEGAVNPGEAQFFVVVQRGRDLEEGHYFVDMNFESNDPTREEFTVPVAGHTADYPRITTGWPGGWGEWWGVDINRILGEIFFGDTVSFNLNANNPGSAQLNVDEINSDNGFFTVIPQEFDVNPNRGQRLTFTFIAGEIDQNSTNIASFSNAWDPRELGFRIVAEVMPTFRLRVELPDTILKEDGVEIAYADLDSIFLSSSRGVDYNLISDGIRGRIERSGELFIQPIPNQFGSFPAIVTATLNDSTLSDTFQVYLEAMPDAPEPFDLIRPSDGDTITWDGIDSLFIWQSSLDVDGDSLFYSLQIWTDTDSLFLPIDFPDTSAEIGTLDQIIDVVQGGTFRWTVTATDGENIRDAWSVFTNHIVSTDVKSTEPISPDTHSLVEIYPNPFNNSATIKVHILSRTHLGVIIYDSAGREIDQIANNTLPIGIHKYFWKPVNLPSGHYFVHVNENNRESIYPLVLSK